MRVLKCGDQFVDGPRDFFVRGEAWEVMFVGEEAYCFALANTVCVGGTICHVPAQDVLFALIFSYVAKTLFRS